ncbi:Ribulokinase [compost metagenome]
MQSGHLLMLMGTSICHMVMSEEAKFIPGVNGVVEDGILSGYFGYEAGQAAGGDMLAWFVKNAVSKTIHDEANAQGFSIYQWLEQKAAMLHPGESGLMTLDWFNGNRSILNDNSLS